MTYSMHSTSRTVLAHCHSVNICDDDEREKGRNEGKIGAVRKEREGEGLTCNWSLRQLYLCF